MSAATTSVAVKRKGLSPLVKRLIWIGVLVLLVIAMALSTKVVPKDSELAQGTQQFNAAEYGATQFPKIQDYIAKNAVDASTLATAVKADAAAAAKQYGKSADGATYIIPVTFTGVVGTIPASGYTPITVTGLPDDIKVGLQLGPAVNGTDLRDVTGTVTLNDFENQIQYQDAGAAINEELKKNLAKMDASGLEGQTVKVEGAFTLINPQQWNVTPSQITVEK
ncbi:DUF2291 domain-containing protein [Microbacterium elymi]|uniref:DUF2291 domain-containing protein n=1 Tax=Microbacterium elymi TaxID=2909587 RepID=A0ABY5NLJ8_9MICO|nr:MULTISPECIES: DUF2291 domain-containing protein [Microbacterium]UUT36025.1 DUF2291 domain-containing protein [Microbacterium elymi]